MAPCHPNIATETSKGLFGDQNTLMALAEPGGEEIVVVASGSLPSCLTGSPAEYQAGW